MNEEGVGWGEVGRIPNGVSEAISRGHIWESCQGEVRRGLG